LSRIISLKEMLIFSQITLLYGDRRDGLDYRRPHSQFKTGDQVQATYLMTKDGKYFKLRKNSKRKKKILSIGGKPSPWFLTGTCPVPPKRDRRG
jgi:hypothetical protein